MATIHSLNTSITQMGQRDLYDLLKEIRTNRRRRPERAMRAKKSVPAKVARAPKKSNLKPNDIFAYTKGLSQDAKAKLAAELLGKMK